MRTWTAVTVALATTLAGARAPAQSTCDAPQVLVVLDRSSSMGARAPLADGSLKWDAAVEAITELTAAFETNVHFGLMRFPADPGECTPGAIDVPVGPLHAAAIAGALGPVPPTSGFYTPMSRSLYIAAEYAPLADPARRSFVALVADGWEWCDPYDPATRFAPVGAVEALSARGITTFVIGFGGSVDTLTLNRMARAAGTDLPGCNPASTDPAAPDNCYTQVDDRAGLAAALDEIARRVTDEVCDGLDNDCDGLVDEGLSRACASPCGAGAERCVEGSWTDCDAPEPTVEECDGRDNDCDGQIDEGCACAEGETMACGPETGACEPGLQSCVDGTWGPCVGNVGPSPETCDGLDNDCDGQVDEDFDCGPGRDCVLGECVDVTEQPDEPGPPPVDEADPGPTGPSGCSCRAAGRAAAAPVLGALLLLAGALVSRRLL